MHNMVKEELLDYVSFVDYVKKEIEARMGDGYQVRIYKVMKNNSLELDSLIVLKEGRNFAPNIYLNAYYESYATGTSLVNIINRLCMIYEHCSVPILQEDFEYSFDTMKPYIFFRLISLERNKKLLSQIPHVPFLDLAVTFHCLVRSEEDTIGTIRITNEHMKMWEINLSQIKKLAFSNTKKMFPPIIRTIEKVIQGLIKGDSLQSGNYEFEDSPKDSYPMYILTNEKGINGASCMLYKDVIKDFANLINSDLYILPSSIHEIILIPMENSMDKERFSHMVREINKSQVPIDEVLSDHVYMYFLKTDTITM
ncbi:MAG: hypothetical protein GX321_09675 [Clostridiales bacterium]|nr:hypothetical protein [Clostridiales bacterium]